MFTGIIEEVGQVAALERRDGGGGLSVACALVLEGTRIGDSIAVNGCCLTVTRLGEETFTADLMGETLDRTALGGLAPGAPVNLERALAAGSRFGGHLVQGHVDAVGQVLDIAAQPEWTVMTFSLPPAVAPYVVEKGSIAIDGTSLTVMGVDDAGFQVGLIPHTLAATVLGRRKAGDAVNLEADVVAKYVERMLARGLASPYVSGEER